MGDKTNITKKLVVEDPVYEARKGIALAFVNGLRHLSRNERQVLVCGTAESEMVAAQFVVNHLKRRARLDGSIESVRDVTIKSQLEEIRKLAAVTRLWAFHDEEEGSGTIGYALAKSCKPGKNQDGESLLYQLISSQDQDALLEAMIPVVTRLKQTGVPLNWVRLVIDLDVAWSERREVQVRWAKDFYSNIKSEKKPKKERAIA